MAVATSCLWRLHDQAPGTWQTRRRAPLGPVEPLVARKRRS